MARYRIRKDHFLQDPERGLPPQFHHAGAVIEWHGLPSMQMEPLDEEARAAVAGRPDRIGTAMPDVEKNAAALGAAPRLAPLVVLARSLHVRDDGIEVGDHFVGRPALRIVLPFQERGSEYAQRGP